MISARFGTVMAGALALLLAASPAALADKGGSPNGGGGNGNAGASSNAGGNGGGGASAKGSSQGNGAVASALGGLNAAHASEAALLHASLKSRVGMIAVYKAAETAALAGASFDTVMAGQSSELQTAYADFKAGTITADAFRTLIAGDATLTAQFDQWQQDLAAATAFGQTDPDAALAAAANKPVDASVKAELDALLGIQ